MSLKKRMQRSAEKRARDRAAIKAEGPRTGDIVVGCVHKPDPRFGAHCFYVGTDTGKPALKIASHEELAKWIFLCNECNDLYKSRMQDALEKCEVPLKYVHTWSEEDGVLKIIPVTFEPDVN